MRVTCLYIESRSRGKAEFRGIRSKLDHLVCTFIWSYDWHVSTVDQIAAAIEGLSWREKEELLERLPAILPELDGDAKWERIIRDCRPRPALEKLLDEAEIERRDRPQSFRETSDEEFQKNS